jgi:ADP-ribose pyrophosphatase YjhB (NUDIX family)
MSNTVSELAHMGSSNMSAQAVIERDGKWLLGLRHYTPEKWKAISVWTTPGGRCEDGETIETSLRREVAEEVGITDLDIQAYLGSVPGVYKDDQVIIFKCTTNQEPQLLEPEKFSEWKWTSKNQVPDNFINPGMLEFLRQSL